MKSGCSILELYESQKFQTESASFIHVNNKETDNYLIAFKERKHAYSTVKYIIHADSWDSIILYVQLIIQCSKIGQIPKRDIWYSRSRYSRKNKKTSEIFCLYCKDIVNFQFFLFFLEYREYKMSIFGICFILYFVFSACRGFCAISKLSFPLYL